VDPLTSSRGAPPRFERAITWTRLAGAVAVVLVAPFLPNLGEIAVVLLASSLVASAITLHVLAGRIQTAADARRFSWATFFWDVIVIVFAILLMTPDPGWPLIPLIGVIFIITATFRLGAPAALIAAGVMAVAAVAIAVWRQAALGLEVSPAHIGFVLTMYVLTALVMTSMLREYDRLRDERADLIRTDRQRSRELEHEREARTEAEVAITRLGAVERISERALRHDSVATLLDEALAAIAAAVDARAGVILTPSGDGVIVRAAYGLTRRPSTRLPSDETALGDELVPFATERVRSRIVVRLRVDGTTHGVLFLGFDRDQALAAPDRQLLDLIAARLASALARAERFDAERFARTQAETAAERARLLVAAADAASSAGDMRARFDRLARLVVPKIADSCAILVIRAGDVLECVALASSNAERERDMWMVDHHQPRPHGATDPSWAAITGGEPRVIEHVGPDDLRRLARGPEHLRMLLERGTRSWMAIPIAEGARALGVIELSDEGSGRSFSDEDVATARSFAARVAVAAAVAARGDTMG
jgi:GAF domain-containing protein